ncbi:hypothetical protein VTL71DRAFT_6688 [Oculimacula yallundae]|uniref:Putative zinc-finger domain-containing protein n=1 Tax=Oculimacula yallundae TaxID=86028 RepID=A0ABR4BXR7_9HELO
MSEYPSTPSYPTGYGARDQTNPPYLPPAYPNQYMQADDGQQGQMSSHYDSSLSAYGYNRSIPSFSASAVAAGVPPLPIFQGWNQDSVPLPPYTTPNNGAQYSGYSNSAQHSTPYYQPPTQPAYQHQLPGGKPFEQGDVDEGEFEEPSSAAYNPSDAYGAPQYRENGGTGYVDTAQRAVYSKPKDYSPQQTAYPANNYNYQAGDSSQNRRQKSSSYSPHVSPATTERDRPRAENYNSYAPQNTVNIFNGTPQTQYSWSQNAAGPSLGTKSQTNGHHTSPNFNDSQPPKTPPHHAPVQTASTLSVRSVAESRKKAQGAILNLWPYDVRYQNYIDEGFSKEVVESLFDELKMSRNSAKSANDGAISASTSTEAGNTQPAGKENLSGSTKSIAHTELAGKPTEMSGLQRDRVSLSSLGSTTPAVNSNGSHVSPSTNTVAAPTKPAVMTEKQKTLQSKMEALRKSREERAQKAAAKGVNKPASAGIETSNPQAEQSKSSSAETSHSPQASPSVSIAQPEIDNKPPTTSSAPAPVNLQHQTSIIPGLFLSSGSGTASSNTTPAMLPSNHNNVRKRPVAADFDEAAPASAPFKRPFGHSRADNRLVITVSDDEADSSDEDVAMELESQATQDSPVQLARKMSDHRSTSFQNLPPLSSFPARKVYTPPPNSSATNTPPRQAAPNTAGRLTHVQTEMEKLKKEIAMREARRRAKQASNGSGSRTPQVSEDNGATATPSTASIASKVESSVKMQEMIETATSNAAVDQQRLAEAQAAEVEKAVELKKSQDEQKRLRREKLAADIPRVDAEVQQNQSRLEQLRAEMAKIEASVQKSLDDKRLLAEEMERLGQEAEEQLQAQKEKLNALTINGSTTSDGPSRPTSSNLDSERNEPSEIGLPSATPTAAFDQLHTPASPASGAQTALVNDNIPSIDVAKAIEVNGTNLVLDDHNTVGSPVEPSSQTLTDGKDQEVVRETPSTDQALEAALQEAVRAEVDSHGQQEDDMDIEDFYAPDASQLAPQTPSHVHEEARSPEYSPALDRTVPDVPQNESDDYEPPEATPPLDEQPAPESPPFSPAPPEIVSDVADDDNLDIDMPEFEPAPAGNDVEEGRSVENLPCTNGSLPKVVENSPKAVNKLDSFTPYESPLKNFRAYRFHPNFKQDVSGGLRSKTYSHKIDSMNEFCRFELAGGICNDPTCDSQHFRDIDVADDAVLTALGSPDDFKGEQRDRFCAGLRGVLLDLRVRKIRDFEVIASEIIAHRANFLGDKSKVLATLEGTTI